MLSLILAALFFIGIHLGIAGTVIRDRAIAILGENGYRAGFAIATLIGLGWLVAAYNRTPYLGTWGMLEWWKPTAIILMLPASLLIVVGLTTPNPTSVAQEGRVAQPPQGIVRITRHPFLTGSGRWRGAPWWRFSGNIASRCLRSIRASPCFRFGHGRRPVRQRLFGRRSGLQVPLFQLGAAMNTWTRWPTNAVVSPLSQRFGSRWHAGDD
jgi:NnrU protein